MTRADEPRQEPGPSILPLVGRERAAANPHDPGAVAVQNPSSNLVPSLLPVAAIPPDGGKASRGAATDRDVATAPAVPAPPTGDALASGAQDPRLLELEKTVGAGDWRAVAETLGADAGGSGEGSPPHSPALELLYALAVKEAELPVSEADRDNAGPTRLAIRAMAALLGVAETSPVALVLAKRLLRTNPVSWRQRRAPPVGTSLLIVLVAIAVGLAVGYAVSAGVIEIHLPSFG